MARAQASTSKRGNVERVVAPVLPRNTTVADIMSRPAKIVAPDTTIETVRHLLLDSAISGMPVVDEDGEPIGMLSRTDLLRAGDEGMEMEDLLEGRDAPAGLGYEARLTHIGHRTVRDVMTPRVFSVPTDATVAHAAQEMTARHVHRLVVLDAAGKISGVVTSLDVLRWLARATR